MTSKELSKRLQSAIIKIIKNNALVRKSKEGSDFFNLKLIPKANSKRS